MHWNANDDTLNIYFLFLAKCQETPVFEASMNETASAKSCHYWTFFPPYKCYILDGCKETESLEAKSGDRNCPPGKSWRWREEMLWHFLLWILLIVSFLTFNLSCCQLWPVLPRMWVASPDVTRPGWDPWTMSPAPDSVQVSEGLSCSKMQKIIWQCIF